MFRGLAPDGGMFMPASLPVVPLATLAGWATLPYKELCVQVLGLFISVDEVPTEALRGVVDKAFRCLLSDSTHSLRYACCARARV